MTMNSDMIEKSPNDFTTPREAVEELIRELPMILFVIFILMGGLTITFILLKPFLAFILGGDW